MYCVVNWTTLPVVCTAQCHTVWYGTGAGDIIYRSCLTDWDNYQKLVWIDWKLNIASAETSQTLSVEPACSGCLISCLVQEGAFSPKFCVVSVFTLLPSSRGELIYLAPLGSENISAPYFKQCFFGGCITPQTESNTTPPSPKTEITNILFYTGCFTTLGHNCRRWFPRSLWWKKFI